MTILKNLFFPATRNITMRNQIAIASSVLFCACVNMPVVPALAEDTSAGSSNSDSAAATSAASASGASASKDSADSDSTSTLSKPSRVLEGGVKGTAIMLEEGLGKIGLASDVIQESTMKIVKEAMRKDTIVMRGPNVLPGGVVIPGLGGSNGVMQFGELPIRRAKLEAFLSDSEQNIKALQTYIDALILPDGISSDASQAYSELKASMEVVQDHLGKLKELSSAKKLANTRIAKEALKIHDTISDMQRQKSSLMQATEKIQVIQKQ